MFASRRSLAFVVACVSAAFVVTTAATSSIHVGASALEIARLRAHFDSVLGELRAADVSALASSQRLARETLIARLEQYAAAGRFPHNHVRPGRFVPVFRDEHGTLCAMAYLIASTGRADIVDDVARTNNLAYIPELAADARLSAWLDSTGLTVAEAARIQPGYDGGGCCTIGPTPDPDAANAPADRREYFIRSAFASTLSGASLFLNMAPGNTSLTRTRWISGIGFASGAAQLVYGSLALSHSDARRTVGAANIAIGGSTIAASAWRMMHPPKANPPTVSVSVQPFVMTARGVGLLLSARL
jgi:hypothetical protein